jgi:hypothetical protein
MDAELEKELGEARHEQTVVCPAAGNDETLDGDFARHEAFEGVGNGSGGQFDLGAGQALWPRAMLIVDGRWPVVDLPDRQSVIGNR